MFAPERTWFPGGSEEWVVNAPGKLALRND
jgi:hypothetical protein